MTSVFDTESETRRVLAIDGGGMRGALAVGILTQLEQTLRDKFGDPHMVLSDYFDLIGGTSTGAIIAAGLALGQDCAYLRELYHRLGPIVFAPSGIRIPILQSKFDPKRLAGVIIEELGHATLETSDWRTGFAAIAKRVDSGSAWILTNCPHSKYWNGTDDPDVVPNKDYELSMIVQASAAAPFYFDMITMPVFKDHRGVFFDGAMTPFNNPVLQLAMTALVPAYGFNWQAGAKKLLVVSVGTGQARPEKPEWVDQPLLLPAWKAIHALTALAYDTGQLGISIMQWLGDSPQRWRINGEVEGLENAMPKCAEPLWTFVRYDAPLNHAWLKDHLGEEFTGAEIAKLGKMDDHTMVPELFRVGRKAAVGLINASHFDDFDPKPKDASSRPSPPPKRRPRAAAREAEAPARD
jgi:hypothetical protein